jgi:hypothetical protein
MKALHKHFPLLIYSEPSSTSRLASRVIARDWLGSENSAPSLPKATSNVCFPTSIAAFTPPIPFVLTAAGAATQRADRDFLVAQTAIERFNECILHRFAGRDVVPVAPPSLLSRAGS